MSFLINKLFIEKTNFFLFFFLLRKNFILEKNFEVFILSLKKVFFGFFNNKNFIFYFLFFSKFKKSFNSKKFVLKILNPLYINDIKNILYIKKSGISKKNNLDFLIIKNIIFKFLNLRKIFLKFKNLKKNFLLKKSFFNKNLKKKVFVNDYNYFKTPYKKKFKQASFYPKFLTYFMSNIMNRPATFFLGKNFNYSLFFYFLKKVKKKTVIKKIQYIKNFKDFKKVSYKKKKFFFRFLISEETFLFLKLKNKIFRKVLRLKRRLADNKKFRNFKIAKQYNRPLSNNVFLLKKDLKFINYDLTRKGIKSKYKKLNFLKYYFSNRFFFCYLKRSENNIFVTITDLKGNVKISLSTGNIFPKRKNKKFKFNSASCFRLGINLAEILIENLKSKALNVVFRNDVFGPRDNFFKYVIKGLEHKNIIIVTTREDNFIAHNGCRERKAPRK